ncbi:unnamed protein product [Caenorhabditis angaria]|uniref:Uncharacterized protein n=1 Tax=Caenorhabditis angaria TaxID=860376 RepID=A0A9P1NB81_9PELO|nr:unnamed protein product [Caenorhabditis angaria]
MAPKPIKDTKSTVPQVDDSAEPGPSSSSSQSSSQSQEPAYPLAEEADDEIIFLKEVQKPSKSAKKESVKKEDESDGEDSDESEEVDSDGVSDDQGESDDSEDIESDEEGEKEEQEESDDENESDDKEEEDGEDKKDSSIEILDSEDDSDDGEVEKVSEEDSTDGEKEDNQEEEGEDSRVARSRRVPPASNDQIPTTSTSRKRQRSPSIEIVEEQSTSRRSQTTPKKQKKGRLEVQEDNQERVTGEEEAGEVPEVSDDSNDDEDEDRIDANYIRRFLNHSVQRNPQVYGNIPNVSDFLDYTMNYIRSNQELLNDLTNSDQRLFAWYNENFVIGSQNWMEFTNNPDSFEDLHRNQFEHSIEDDGTFVSVPLDPMPVLFPSAIQGRLIERAREQHDWIVDHREAQYLMVLQRGREIERRGEEVRNLMRRNEELVEEINQSRRQ